MIIRFHAIKFFAIRNIPAKAGIQCHIAWIPCQARNVVQLSILLEL
jgi:hypothetical protein